MNIREYLNNNPAVVTIAAVVLLLVCLGLIVNSLMGSSSQRDVDVWYYDVASGRLMVAKSQLSPIEGEAGPAMRAYLFSCGDCEDKVDDIDNGMSYAELKAMGVHVGYVSKYSDADKQKLEAQQNDPGSSDAEEPMMIQELYAVVKADGTLGQWTPGDAYGMEGETPPAAGQSWAEIQEAHLKTLCPNGDLKSCFLLD